MKISEFIKQLQDIAVIEGDDINIYYYRERIGPIAPKTTITDVGDFFKDNRSEWREERRV